MVQLTAGWVVKEEESAAINDKWIANSNENEIMKHDGGKLLLFGSERAAEDIHRDKRGFGVGFRQGLVYVSRIKTGGTKRKV